MEIKKNKTILVVEDETALLQAITNKLEGRGHVVKTARSAEEALDEYAKGGIDVIWLDHYLLGELDGIDFLKKIMEKEDKSSVQELDVSIYVVSNTATQEKVQTYQQLGVQRCFVKAESRIEDIAEEICAKI